MGRRGSRFFSGVFRADFRKIMRRVDLFFTCNKIFRFFLQNFNQTIAFLARAPPSNFVYIRVLRGPLETFRAGRQKTAAVKLDQIGDP